MKIRNISGEYLFEMGLKMIIQNRYEIDLRGIALDLAEMGIWRVQPENLLKEIIRFDPVTKTLRINGRAFDLASRRLFVIGAGKASGEMAGVLEKMVPPEIITDGFVNTTTVLPTKKIQIRQASHPIPDENGVGGARAILKLKEKWKIGQNDLVLCLISGGGSALLPLPREGIRLWDKQVVTRLLLTSGADIHEINTVRKHLSAVKGGQLGRHFAPALVISLILSDVIGNDLDVIASGPTVPDSSTFEGAFNVLKKYGLWENPELPGSVREIIRAGQAGRIQETPKSLKNCTNIIIGDNHLALEAMQKEAEVRGLRTVILTAEQTGDPGKAARHWASEILVGKYSYADVLLLGGETTPKLPTNHGKGGRNQHFAASTLLSLQNYRQPWALASIGTDGADFLPDVAGAVVDHHSVCLAHQKNLNIADFVACYDSYSLFKTLEESLIVTGNTGTNVGDIAVYVFGKS